PPGPTARVCREACKASANFGTAVKRQQVLDQIILLLSSQTQCEASVVVIDHIQQRRKATIVKEAALLVRPQSFQRRCAVPPVRTAIRLKIINAKLCCCMQVPPWFGVNRIHVTVVASRLPFKQLVASVCSGLVKAAGRRFRRGNRKLIKVKRRKLRCNQILVRI